MEPSARYVLSFSCAIVVAVFSIASRGGAQDETISGNLTVEGRADLLMGPLSLGTSSFYDELDDETTAEGLTIHYSETSQIWSGGNFVQGRSTIVQRVGQELADFYWQTSEPDGLGGFTAVDLMKLSNEQLLVQPSILGQGTLNLLPNQTLSGGNGSILTLGLADNRYLSNAGGTIAGNLTITGSDVTINGSKVLTEADEVHFMRHVDGSYVGEASYATPWSSAVAIGHFSRAGESAVAIGAHTGMWEPGTSGIKSVAIGYSARAPGAYSIAIGESNWGGGNESIAIGREAATQADGALSFGRSTKANQVGQIVMGAFNVESVYSATPSPADSLFILGNGTADNARSNALVVKRNGDMEVKGSSLTVNGNQVLTEASGDTRYLKAMSDSYSFVYGEQAEATAWTHSLAIGYHAKASAHAISIGGFTSDMGSGIQSVALGYVARAPGESAVAIGYVTWAAGADSLSIINGSAARTDRTIAIGKGVEATRPGQVALGNYNLFDYVSHTSSPGDQIFVIGNGTADDARSNALVVKRNGDMEVKGTSLTVNGNEVLTQADALTTYVTQTVASTNFIAKDAVDSQLPNQVAGHVNSILTKGIADGLYLSSGSLDGITFKFGSGAIAVSEHSIVLGHHAKANTNAISIGSYASDMGGNMGSGTESVALGYAARSPGNRSSALGYGTWAEGNDSIAMNHESGAYAERSIAIGKGTNARRYGQVVLGSYNASEYTVHTPDPFDSIFVIGNGTADNARSNALVVRRNGDMEVMGTSLTVNGEAVLTEAALDAAIETVNLGGGNYLSKNPLIGLTYGTNTTAAAHSVALGEESVASGTLSSSAMGYDTLANQSGTHALGNYLVANRPGQIVLGNYNDFGLDSAGSATSDPADAIFVIGNGSADNARSNALVIKRGGDIALQGTSLTYNGAGLLTQASADTLYLSQAQATANYLTVAAATAAYQTKPAVGIDFLTSEDLVTIQANIEAKIDEAELETALENIDLSGNYLSSDPQVGLAYGMGSSAVAASSSAIGEHVEANMTGQVVVGRYNKVETASNPPTEDDPVFVVGVGNGIPEDEGERKNAVVVKRNGDVNVTGGVLRVMPAGDLSMDGFTSGPTPIDLE